MVMAQAAEKQKVRWGLVLLAFVVYGLREAVLWGLTPAESVKVPVGVVFVVVMFLISLRVSCHFHMPYLPLIAYAILSVVVVVCAVMALWYGACWQLARDLLWVMGTPAVVVITVAAALHNQQKNDTVIVNLVLSWMFWWVLGVCVMGCGILFAQGNHLRSSIDVGVGGGPLWYIGDIGSGSTPERPFIYDVQWQMGFPWIGVYGRYLLHKNFRLRAELIASRIQGDDRLARYWPRRYRNLHFRSPVTSLMLQVEMRPVKIPLTFGKLAMMRRPTLTPVLAGGVGVLFFDPRARYNGRWYRLRPLSTEGQGIVDGRKRYSNFQPVIPVVFFLEYVPGAATSWSFAVGLHWIFTFTDYLDDVSTTYPDFELLERQKGSLAVVLSSRTHEITSDPLKLIYYQSGQMRGDPTDYDHIFYFSFIAFYNLPAKGRMPCPRFGGEIY